MNENSKMNVLVIGMSGAGKSTLIKEVSGKEVKTGTGEAVTKETEAFDCDVWPLRLIDTQGFEYKSLRQIKSVLQISGFIKKNKGIDAIWYCIDSETKRVDTHNIELLSKAIKGWNNMPLFVVLTKAYSKYDINDNIEAVKKAFENTKITNVKEIIPVVAEKRIIDENTTIEANGLEDLCTKTLECWDEAQLLIYDKNQQKDLTRRRFTSQTITLASTATAFTIGAVPLNYADAALLMPLETGMTTAIMWTYGVKNKTLVTSIVGSQAITIAAKQIVTAIKTIPGVGDVVNGVVAGVIVFALGEAVTAIGEGIYTEKYKVEDIDNIVSTVIESVKTNPILNATISYIEKNQNKLKDKKANEIFEEIVKENK